MGLFSKRMDKRVEEKVFQEVEAIKEIIIQAYPEGSKAKMDIESLLMVNNLSMSVPGITNSYRDYATQTDAIYAKYNSMEEFGNQMVRTIIDFRTAFLSGEGISVSSKNERTAKWLETFIQDNKLNGSTLVNLVKGSEMAGQSLVTLKVDKETGEVSLHRKPYNITKPYRAKYDQVTFELIGMQERNDLNGWVSLNIKDYIYIRVGGDDVPSDTPTTRTGVVLTDIDNYDRAIKDIRRNNHVFARITPVFQVDNEGEAKSLKVWLSTIKWKIGTAFIGKAKFSYESPNTTAYQNLTSELTSVVKVISGITGIPVHWLGYVDLMSNRSTADSLYEVIKNATLNERLIWEEGIYDILLKAQEMYIDSGGKEITLDKDFQVRLPLIDFASFKSKVDALSKAYADEAISLDDYRNQVPGIDPIKTAKAIEIEKKATEDEIVRMGLPNINDEENEDGKQSSQSE